MHGLQWCSRKGGDLFFAGLSADHLSESIKCVCVFFKGIEILEARIFFKKDVVFERTMGIDSWRHIYIYIYLYIC